LVGWLAAWRDAPASHYYYRDHNNSTRRTIRSRRGGAPFSFTDVGEGDLTAFFVDSKRHKNLISIEVFKQLVLLKTSHPHPYNTEWLRQG
jgi:hypothetical protein